LFCAQSNDVIILCGDLNCRGVDGSCVHADLAVLFDSLGLTQFVACATRVYSLLDVFTSSDPTTVTNVHVDDAELLSDHRLVAARTVVTRLKVNYIWRNIKALDLIEFEQLVRHSAVLTIVPTVLWITWLRSLSRCLTGCLFAENRNRQVDGCHLKPLLQNVNVATSNDTG
jgi:hypothetical protein